MNMERRSTTDTNHHRLPTAPDLKEPAATPASRFARAPQRWCSYRSSRLPRQPRTYWRGHGDRYASGGAHRAETFPERAPLLVKAGH